jgi:hypothetical protein
VGDRKWARNALLGKPAVAPGEGKISKAKGNLIGDGGWWAVDNAR